MSRLWLHLFGSFQARIAEQPMTGFDSDKTRALLAYLAVLATLVHPRAALIGLFWANSTEQAARRNLSQALFNLRHLLGDQETNQPFLLVTRESVQFNPQSDHWLDVAVFTSLLDECRLHPHTQLSACAACAERLTQAVKLYAGPFLPHLAIADSAEFEEWVVFKREELQRRALDALAQLAEYYLARGECATALPYARRQLELDAWCEEAHRQVMRTLALSGQRSAALAQYDVCCKLLTDQVGVEPEPETQQLVEQIRRGELSQARQGIAITPQTARSNLPTHLTPFVGRERELAELAQLLTRPEARLITLVGQGGTGKTRLAIQAAFQAREQSADAVYFVPLASVESVELIPASIAQAIGLTFSGTADAKTQLLDHLREKRALLIVDNFEQLVDGVGLLLDILQRAPQVKLIVTSREALNVQGEWVFPVSGLGKDAIELFLNTARRTRADFESGNDNLALIGRICNLVDGLPLGVELAATWVRMLSCQEIAEGIERDIGFLSTTMRDVPARHHSLMAVFDQSWKMLSDEERHGLQRMSIFRGGFTRQASERVANAPLALLAALVSKSLIRRTGSGRYDLHELVRQFAATKLASDPTDQTATRDRHSDYYLAFVRKQEDRLCSHQQKDALAELNAEIDNIRLAIDWAIDQQQISRLSNISFALLYFYEIRGLDQEGETVFRHAAEMLQARQETDALVERARQIAFCDMQTNHGYFAIGLGKTAEACAMLCQCIEQLRSLGEQTVLRYALRYCGLALTALNRLDEADSCQQASLELSLAEARSWEIGITNFYLGYNALLRDAFTDSQHYLNQGLEIGRSLGDPRLIAVNQAYLSYVYLSRNQPAEAQKPLQEALRLTQDTGDRDVIAIVLALLGRVAQARGEPAEARRLFEESIELSVELGNTTTLSSAYVRLGEHILAIGDLREAENTFHKAIKVAVQNHDVLVLHGALLGLATVRAREGASASALELITHILQYPSSRKEIMDRARQLRAELETQLTPEQIETVTARAQSKSFDAVIKEALT